MPRGIGQMCLTGGETPEAKPGGTRMPQGIGKLCLTGDPSPEAKQSGALRWRITPLDDGELGALAY